MMMCFSLAACGSTDSSSDGSEPAVKSPWGQPASSAESVEDKESSLAESSAEESEPEGSSAEKPESEPESKADTSKPEETAPPESKAEEPVTEASKAESEPEPAESKAEPQPAESQADAQPADDGDISFTLNGSGYTVSFGEGWTDITDKKDTMAKQSADKAGELLNIDRSNFTGMDTVCYYNSQAGETPPVFNVLEPVTNPLFEAVKTEDLEQMMILTLQQQLQGQEGVKVGSNGIKEYNGVKFIEIFSEYDTADLKVKARQFFALHGSTQYLISFSIPGDRYDEMYDETEKVMNTFRFTD